MYKLTKVIILFGLLLAASGCSKSNGSDKDSDSSDQGDTDIVIADTDTSLDKSSDTVNDTGSDDSDTVTDFETDTHDPVLEVRVCYPVWKSGSYPVSKIPFNKMTHLVLSFALPEVNGVLNTSFISDIKSIVSAAHGAGVKVELAIGGANGSENFYELSLDDTAREAFIVNLKNYVKDNSIDGVKIDWEYWPNPENVDTERSGVFLKLLQDIYAAMNPMSVEVGIDVYASDYYGKHFPDEIGEYSDYINIMTIDDAGAWSTARQHSSMELVKSSVAYWQNRIGDTDAQRFTITIPFYGYEFDSDHTPGSISTVRSWSYAAIAAKYPESLDEDEINTSTGTIYYNGKNTVKEKAKWAYQNGLKGTVSWELSFDSKDESQSLLTVLKNNR